VRETWFVTGTLCAYDHIYMAEVYALEDPVSGRTRYIGHTAGRATWRLQEHLSSRARPKVRRWVESLRAHGKAPRLVVLAVTSTSRAKALERHLIGADSSLLNTRLVKTADHRDSDAMPDWFELTAQDDTVLITDR
jgi:hypothetical protein